MGKILGKEELNKLPTKVNYSYFNEERGDCNNFHFYHSTASRLTDYFEVQEITDKIMKALCYVYNESKSSSFDNNICHFLYYWISDMLLTHLKTPSSYNSVISFLFDVFYITHGNKVCDVLHWNMENEKHFKDIKLMFDFSKDYNTYKKQLTEPIPQCYNNYMNYLDEYVNTYNKLHDECKGENSEELYCKLFKKYLDYKEYNHLSSLKCNLKEEEIQPEQLLDGKVNVGEHLELNVSPGLREANATGHHDLLHNQSGEKTYEMDRIETNGKDTPTSIASPTVIGMTTIAGIVVPSYLAYNVISIVIKKLNVILYI
ncbi:unnamed protein product [Plasmodium vivax]|uniref:(malaria parasite P. vivax) hypothetical protein n=1 Tax=Plasmodium vivax TaxID=5855 RepID=A0A8S4HBJ7_PLAVI|nr:unnamed protein product [Plasmodium vivax]